MKASLAILLGAIAFGVSAAPAGVSARTDTQVTVSLINDQSGANAAKPIPANGNELSIKDLFGNTPVGTAGSVFASSAQLIQFTQTTHCTIKNNGQVIGNINFQQTFADIDGNNAAAVPINLDYATIACAV
jgi:hypothetical protein